VQGGVYRTGHVDIFIIEGEKAHGGEQHQNGDGELDGEKSFALRTDPDFPAGVFASARGVRTGRPVPRPSQNHLLMPVDTISRAITSTTMDSTTRLADE
jgi:hypothetical protein